MVNPEEVYILERHSRTAKLLRSYRTPVASNSNKYVLDRLVRNFPRPVRIGSQLARKAQTAFMTELHRTLFNVGNNHMGSIFNIHLILEDYLVGVGSGRTAPMDILRVDIIRLATAKPAVSLKMNELNGWSIIIKERLSCE